MKKKNPRRGIAIEFAIGLMLLTIAFSILMVTVSMLQSKGAKEDLADFKETILAMQKEDLADNASQEIWINDMKYTVARETE